MANLRLDLKPYADNVSIMGRVVTLMIAYGLSIYDLSVKTGIAEGSIARSIKSGKISKLQNIEKIAAALNTTVAYLQTGTQSENIPKELVPLRSSEIKIFERIAAGSATEIFDNPIDTIHISHPVINSLKGQVVGFYVKGDSMTPRITEGDTVITKMLNLPLEKPRDRDLIVTVFHNQTNYSEGNLKLFTWDDKDKNKFILSSINARHTPKTYSMKDVRYMFRVYLVISKIDYR